MFLAHWVTVKNINQCPHTLEHTINKLIISITFEIYQCTKNCLINYTACKQIFANSDKNSEIYVNIT